MRKLNVAVLAGGRSSEHDISRLSACSIIEGLDREKYEPFAVLIERSGEWRLTSAEKLALPEGTPRSQPKSEKADTDAGALMRRQERRPATVTDPSSALRNIDVIFPVLHGPFGEDGTIQGLLETANVPYVGAGVLASAVGMDKAITKALLRDEGIPVAPGLVTRRADRNDDAVVAQVEAELGYPVFVKPSRLGSSIGISRATDAETLRAALQHAFEHDSKVVVEASVEGVEVECGVLGNDDPIVSLPGQVRITGGQDWYDFEAKYADGNVELQVPAPISETATKRVQEVALDVYRAIDCTGLARVDCFVGPNDEVVVNEVNTMPGFTATSAYAKLFEASGIRYNDLVDRLIQLAIDRHQEQQTLRF
jgi:D-alanine-D-alanine ligase